MSWQICICRSLGNKDMFLIAKEGLGVVIFYNLTSLCLYTVKIAIVINFIK